MTKSRQQIKGWLQSSLSLQTISASCCPPDWLQQVTRDQIIVPELPVLNLFWQPLHIFANVISRMAEKSCLSSSRHTRVSSACLTKPAEKVCAINFLCCLTVGVHNYWQLAVFFVPQSHIFQPFQRSAPRKKTSLYRCKTQDLQSISHNTVKLTTLSWAS